MPTELNLFEISKRYADPLHVNFFCEKIEEQLEVNLLFDERFHCDRHNHILWYVVTIFSWGLLCLKRIRHRFGRWFQPLLMWDYFAQELLDFFCVIYFAAELFLAHGCVDIRGDKRPLQGNVIIFTLPPSHVLDQPQDDEHILHEHVWRFWALDGFDHVEQVGLADLFIFV